MNRKGLAALNCFASTGAERSNVNAGLDGWWGGALIQLVRFMKFMKVVLTQGPLRKNVVYDC